MPVAILAVGAVVLLTLSVPIFISLLLPTIVAFNLSGLGLPPDSLVQRAIQGVNVGPLLAVPLFIFAADLISRGEIGSRLVDVVESLVGHIPGGLAIATILTMAVFGAISGIGAAAVVSIGPIVYPALIKQGYGKGFSVGLILTGSTLAMLIPPSVAVILYCIQTNQSIAKVFLSAFGAGIIFSVLLIIYSVIYSLLYVPRISASFSGEKALRALKRSGFALLFPVVIIGGIYSGLATITEAAALAAVYALLVEVLVYRRIKVGQLLPISCASARTIAMVMILVSAGTAMTWFLTLEQVPQMISRLVGTGSAVFVTSVIDVAFLIAGMFIDVNSAVIVLAPLVFPAATAAGVDPVHLGAIITMTLAIGMISPPFGMNLFIAMITFKTGFGEVVKGVVPFLLIALLALALVSYVPDLVMWLPRLSGIS